MAESKSIVLTATAQTQRLAILQYWHDRLGNGQFSAQLAAGFEHCLNMLLRFPIMGKQVPETKYRNLVYRDYMIVYEITASQIIIHQFWDTRQNPNDLSLDD